MKNNHHKIKLIAASVALTTSFSAAGGLGGLNVQSNLGEPFSGTVTVTGEEAKILLNGGQASLSDGNFRTSVRKSGDNAVISIRSNAPINDPVLVFQVGVGSQSRQYTAIIDPPDYASGDSASAGRQTESEHASFADTNNQDHAAVDVKQSAAAQAKLKAKKAQQEQAKQEKKEQQKAAQAAKSEKTHDIKTDEGERITGSYTVRRGETLTSIASRVRPEGLSLKDTVKALVLANPEAFKNRNANQITAGRALHIPSGNELKRLLKQDADLAGKKEQATKTQNDMATAAASASSAQSAIEAPAKMPASEAMPASSVASASDAVANISASSPDTGLQSASAPIRDQETSASHTVSSSSAEQVSQPLGTSETASFGWWRWLLFGGLGIIALWLLLRLAAGRRGDVQEQVVLKDDADVDEGESFEEDEVVTHQIRTHQPIVHPSNAAPLTRTTVEKEPSSEAKITDEEGLDVEDDFDDDIFFTEAETEPAADKSENNFNLDLGSIDREQAGILSGALTQDEETEKRKDVDWDAIESTESIYEPEPENEYSHVAVEFTAVDKVDVDTDEDTVVEAESTHIEQAAEWSAASIEVEPATVASEEVVAEVPSEKASDAVTETLDTNRAEDQESGAEDKFAPLEFESVVSEEYKQTAAEQTSSVPVDDISGSAESGWLDVNQDEEEGIAFQDGKELESTVNLVADSTETIEWESIGVEDEAARSGSSFISESVGMTAPLEAKYELAQMYVEIGDPEAARETLQELLEESSGSILERTKAMLAELDKK